MTINVKNLTKSYRNGEAEIPVLNTISFSIESGEFVAIIGSSGSGKTTLLNILGGLDSDYQGEVIVQEHNLRLLNEKQLANYRNTNIGFVFQHFYLLDHLTSLENITLPQYFSIADSPGTDHAQYLLHRLGLSDKADTRPPHLSGGQKQRIAIARALFHTPSILLCDEPTGSLDRKTGEQVMTILKELHAQGMTIIIVTHEPYIAAAASRTICLSEGSIVDDHATQARPVDELSAGSSHFVENS